MYLCVLDFEATCLEDKLIFNQEIIEFPSILFKFEEGQLTKISEFQEYVKPFYNPKLSKYCINLTGITQDIVDKADIFGNVYKRHYLWIRKYVEQNDLLIFVTVGHWDLATMLPSELKLKNMDKYYSIYKTYINISYDFTCFYGVKARGMKNMLEILKIELTGKHHSGIDDCRNTAKILEKMIADGYTENMFHINKL